METDETLMARYKEGSFDAFNQLYTRHKAPVYRFLLRHLNNAETADELHQDVWERLINARNRYKISAKFTTYIYTIANNLLIDHSRRGATHLRAVSDSYIEDEPVAGKSDTLARAIVDDCLALMREAITTLPHAQRDAFVLQQEAGHSLDDIAEVSGTNRETIKSRLRYAMNALREKLKDCL